MNASCIQPGQPLTLSTLSPANGNTYRSTVLQVEPQRLHIGTPSWNGLGVPLPTGVQATLTIETPDGLCRFTTEIISRDTELQRLCLRMPEHFQFQVDGSLTEGRARFTTVTSGKGGVGKTSFLLNYAIALAEEGKRVLVFDADLGMANVDVLMKASARANIVDVIEGTRSMRDAITHTDYGIDLVAGGSGMARLASLSAIQMQRITDGFTWLESHYDHVLIDTGAGLSRNVTSFVFAADETIVVTTPEPHAITDAYAIIKVILEENRHVRLKLVINKCESLAEGAAVMKRFTGVILKFLEYKITPIGCLPESRAVSKSIRAQTPLMAFAPTCDIARGIRDIAQAECEGERHKQQPVPHTQKRPTGQTFVGRFMQLFSQNSHPAPSSR